MTGSGHLGQHARTVRLALFALGYLACNELSFLLEVRSAGVAVFWPGSGLAVVAVLAVARRDRRLVLALIVVINALAGMLHGRPAGAALGTGLANAVETALFVEAFTRFGGRRPIADLRRWVRFLAALVPACVGGAVVGAGSIALGSGADPLTAARTWFLADLVGMLVVATPFVLARSARAGSSRATVETVAAGAVVAATLTATFMPHSHLPIVYLVLPPLLWPALRLGMRSTAWLAAGLCVGATVLTLADRGPFGGLSDDRALVLLQAMFVAVVVSKVTLAVAVEQGHRALLRVGAAERRFRASFDDALLGMLVVRVDDDGEGPDASGADDISVLHANSAVRRMVGGTPSRVAALLDVPDVRAACLAVADGSETTWSGEVELPGAPEPTWFEVAVARAVAADDGSLGTTLTIQLADVSARRLAEARLTELALYDGLTGLPNRTLLRDRLDVAIRVTRREKGQVAVLFCDLDDFKTVNDVAGHSRGDTLLQEVAKRLQRAVRPGDTVARFGGDEFVVLCPSVPDEQVAEAVAARMLATLSTPVVVDGVPYVVGASVGVALAEPHVAAEDLLRQADSAMYAAKNGGKGRTALFRADMHTRVARQATLAAELRTALAETQFRLHFQPVVDLSTSRVVGVEALVRWEHPTRGILAPAEWLDVAEQSDVVLGLGRWVLGEACRRAAVWQKLFGEAAPVMHANVSARHVTDPGFVDDVLSALEGSGCAAHSLVLELTETHLLSAGPSVRRDLARLRAAGVRLAADDYGTGYSALSQVTELDVDILKIDKSFVQAMLTDRRARAVAHAVIGLGASLDLEVVAEGVETAEHAAELLAMGCTTAQGYLWSAPRPAADLGDVLRAGTVGGDGADGADGGDARVDRGAETEPVATGSAR